jgi:hypothetical protein
MKSGQCRPAGSESSVQVNFNTIYTVRSANKVSSAEKQTLEGDMPHMSRNLCSAAGVWWKWRLE